MLKQKIFFDFLEVLLFIEECPHLTPSFDLVVANTSSTKTGFTLKLEYWRIQIQSPNK